ncbi:MAG: thermonuclease family protein [Leptolyngbyaceae cyanobacterium T60_A2020_046]|nr:thermonuclease family protein [Leptolyngbyaceae cyanobacterium T60_A2020_046]
MGTASSSNWARRGGYALVTLGIVVLIAIAAALATPETPSYPVVIQRAQSGQSITLTQNLSATLPTRDVRLAHIAVPDFDQKPWGSAAQRYLDALWLAHTRKNQSAARIEPTQDTLDHYSRAWGNLYLKVKGGKELWANEEMLRSGYAYLEPGPGLSQRQRDRLIYAQEAARLLGLGIWDPRNPLRETAAAFRQGSRNDTIGTPDPTLETE